MSANKRRLMAEINVVPYIDVMLVLLIIFMITAPLVQQGVEIELPTANANPIPPEQREPVVLSVTKQGDYFLNIGEQKDKPIAQDAMVKLIALVMKNQPETPVLVRGDQAVEYGKVTAAMVLLQAAGVAKVGLMTEPPENTGR
jgi:biopolymer transport protein TolR